MRNQSHLIVLGLVALLLVLATSFGKTAVAAADTRANLEALLRTELDDLRGVTYDQLAAPKDVRRSDGGRIFFSAATGNPGLLIVALDDGAGASTIHIGPVSSFYWTVTDKRLTDQQWRSNLRRDRAEEHKPDWTHNYWARDHH